MTTPEVSHGRGGAGNINKDDTKYVDGEVVRSGVEGSHNDGAYSTGRGGAANIGDVGTRSATRLDKDVVPEAAIRPSTDNSDYHVGRGGAGNEHLSKTAEVKKANGEHAIVDAPMSLADKLKRKIFGGFGKK